MKQLYISFDCGDECGKVFTLIHTSYRRSVGGLGSKTQINGFTGKTLKTVFINDTECSLDVVT